MRHCRLKQWRVIFNKCFAEVDLIENERAPNPRLEALYILTPTSKNVERIMRDFEAARSVASPVPRPSFS